MRKIIDYEIVAYTNYEAGKMKVREMIKAGWEPVGGVSFENGWMHQAMVKRLESNTLPGNHERKTQ